jgi:chromosomal replication initiation ATPase DnaA
MEIDEKISMLLKEVEVLILKHIGASLELNYTINNLFENDPNYLSVKKIIEEECQVANMLYRSRGANYIKARAYFIYWLKNNTKLTTTQIGSKVNLDHSTVIYTIKKMSGEFEIYENARLSYAKIETKIKQLIVSSTE